MGEELTVTERQRFWAALDKMEEAHDKINKVYALLAGDKELHQEGLIERVGKLEDDIEYFKKQVEKVKGWIAGALFAGSVLGSLVTLFINYLINKK